MSHGRVIVKVPVPLESVLAQFDRGFKDHPGWVWLVSQRRGLVFVNDVGTSMGIRGYPLPFESEEQARQAASSVGWKDVSTIDAKGRAT